MKFFLCGIIGIVFLCLSAIGWLYFNQEKLLFFPEVLSQKFAFTFPVAFKESTITLHSGEIINFLTFNPESQKGVLLYFHGNAGSLKDWGLTAARISEKTGWSVWIMDYPGYGKSTGHLPKNEKPLLEVGRLLCQEISKRHTTLPLVLYGRSLGSGIATSLAHEVRPTGLILETPYRSVAKLGHEIYPFLPESFSRFDLDNEKWLPQLKPIPILILHGTGDQVIPYAHGEFLKHLVEDSQLVTFPEGEHNNLDAFPQYWSAVVPFLTGLEKP
ncbi:MAG: alpha/beta fold hydrolase [Bdellovibrionales bacterium]|nr:alpha/beta fold hydrolase [Bdellovibrionales bacterium]